MYAPVQYPATSTHAIYASDAGSVGVVLTAPKNKLSDNSNTNSISKWQTPAATAVAQATVRIPSLAPGSNAIKVQLEVKVGDVQLWQPAGYGSQPLFSASLTYTDPAGVRQKHTRRIGLRTVRLVTDPTPPNRFNKTGETFYFEVNGVPIYAKGANWIPADAFAERATDARDPGKLDWLLQSAVDANMNMVRVWGGGFYQPDAFYDLCDEKGLLVWQEIMFACALYPTDAAFLASVKAEVSGQVKRLQSHASIAIWGGNNENEAAVGANGHGWYPPYSGGKYKTDYITLYLDTVRAAIRIVDPAPFPTSSHDPAVGGRPFVDSSPSNGLLEPETTAPVDSYKKRWGNVFDWEYGDLHYYNYEVCVEVHRTPYNVEMLLALLQYCNQANDK